MELMQSAMRLLLETDKQQGDIKLAIPGFARYQNVCMRVGDLTGFHWCLQFLLGIIRRGWDEAKTMDELFTSLLESFVVEDEAVESNEALAAFYVAKFIQISPNFQGREIGSRWYWKCFVAARTNYLRYVAAMGLGTLSLKLDRKEEAAGCFEAAREYAKKFGDRDSFAISSFHAARIYAELERVAQAMETLLAADDGEGRFIAALATSLYTTILTKDQRRPSVEEIIKASTNARTNLANLMPDLVKMLANYCGPLCCSSDDVLKFLNLDYFSKFYIFEASKFSHEVTEPVERSFFVFELAFELRKEMIRIQGQLPLELWMDPRPHLEDGMDMLIWKHGSKEAALFQLVTGQQIAVKTGHETCFFLASTFIINYIQVLQDVSSDDMRSRLVSCFQQLGADDEDPEAWALFYLGRCGIQEDRRYLAESSCRMIEQALQRCRTLTLGYTAAEVLGSAWLNPESVDGKLAYLELMVTYSRKMGKIDMVIGSLSSVFELVTLLSPNFERADSVRREVLQICKDLQPLDRGLPLAVAQYMSAVLHLLLLDFERGTRLLDTAIDLLQCLPRYPPLGYLYYCLACNDGDAWSFEKNTLAQNTYFNAIKLKTRGPFQVDFTFGDRFDHKRLKHDQRRDALHRVELLIVQGNLEEAESHAAEVLQSLDINSEDGSDHTAGATIRTSMARLACAQFQRASDSGNTSALQVKGTMDIIQGFLDEALKLWENKTTPVFRPRLQLNGFHFLLLSELGERAAALEKLEEAIRYGCLELDSVFGSSSWARMMNTDRLTAYFSALHSLLWEFNLMQRALVWGERERARDLLFKLKTEDSRECLKDFVEFDTDFDRAWLEIKGICKMVGKDTAFVVVSQRRFANVAYTFFLHQDTELVGHKHQDFTPVTQLMQAISTRSSELPDLLMEYHNMLIKPFSKQLEETKTKRLIFVPSEEMCMVPFCALLDSSEVFLIQRYAITTVSSLRFFKHCELRARELQQKLEEKTKTTLVVGDPTSDLDFASAEAESVAQLLDEAGFEVSTLVNREATKQMLLSKLPDKCWIHIASHARVNDRYPSGALMLSTCCEEINYGMKQDRGSKQLGSETRSERASVEADESLTGDEIQEKLQAPLEALGVVLSACRSGAGQVISEGVVSLARSLHVKGAPCVVVSLWKVDDEMTKQLMERLYANLLLRGMQLAEALQDATMEAIEKEDQYGWAAENVNRWGAFFISGSPSVTLKPRGLMDFRDSVEEAESEFDNQQVQKLAAEEHVEDREVGKENTPTLITLKPGLSGHVLIRKD